MPTRALAVYTGDALANLTELASASAPVQSFGQTSPLSNPPTFLQRSRRRGRHLPDRRGRARVLHLPAGRWHGGPVHQPGAGHLLDGGRGRHGGQSVHLLICEQQPDHLRRDQPAAGPERSHTGDITGVPQTAGSYAIGLTATNPGGAAAATLLSLSRPHPPSRPPQPPPPLSPAARRSAARSGWAFSYSLAASGNPSGYTAENLPNGLSLNPNSGLIAGTPAAAGDFTVPVSAVNPAGAGTASVVIRVAAGQHPPVITSALAATGVIGSSFYYNISTDHPGGFNPPTSYGAPPNLPPGLGFDPADGLPGAARPRPPGCNVPLAATNSADTARAVVTITIIPPARRCPAGRAAATRQRATATAAFGAVFSYLHGRQRARHLHRERSAAGFEPRSAKRLRDRHTPRHGCLPSARHRLQRLRRFQRGPDPHVTAAGVVAVADDAPPVVTSAAEVGGNAGGFLPTRSGISSDPYSYNKDSAVVGVANLPPGLGFDPNNRLITGYPAAPGTYAVRISRPVPSSLYSYPPQYLTGTAVVTFVINPPASSPPPAPAIPVFTCAASAAGTVGRALPGFTVAATDNPARLRRERVAARADF